MFVNSENWQDCQKYYQNTWVKLAQCGERIYTVGEVGSKFTYFSSPSRGPNDDEADVCIDMSVGFNIDYVIPKKTVFQYGEHALILERVPARMWRKGMDPKNTQFLTLNEMSAWGKVQIGVPVIEGFVNKPGYYQLDAALNNFEGALLSAALSPRVSLSRGGSVFIDTTMVGKYARKSGTLTYKAIYKDDLEPMFPGAKFKVLE